MSTPKQEWLSVCCSAKPLGEIGPPQWVRINKGESIRMATGLCSKCREHTTFELEDEDDSRPND